MIPVYRRHNAFAKYPGHQAIRGGSWAQKALGLFVAIAASFQTLCVQDVVCKYRVHDGSATFRNKLASHLESLEVLRHWGAALDPAELRRREAMYHTLIGIE